jgi:hypothetical protein
MLDFYGSYIILMNNIGASILVNSNQILSSLREFSDKFTYSVPLKYDSISF